MTSTLPRLVLVGGGHAHLEVLRRFGAARQNREDPPVDLTLVSLSEVQHYSGMVPGYLAGIYAEDDLTIALAPLAERAGARFVRAEVVAIEPAERRLRLARGDPLGSIAYDLVSFDVGSLAAGSNRPDVARHAQAVKPIGRAAALRRALDALAAERVGDRSASGPARVVVVGGGAAGVEVAFAVARRIDQEGDEGGARRGAAGGGRGGRVTLVEAGDRLLAGYPPRARDRTVRLLAKRGIHVELGRRVLSVAEDRVVLEGDRELPADLTVWLTGAAAPPLFEGSGLPLDERGFLLVGPDLGSVDPRLGARVFGAGDCVTLAHAPGTPKAGVYAVKEGPVLYESLRAALVRIGRRTRKDPAEGDETPPVYRPQRGFLSLLNTCDGKAVLSWKGFSAHARWAWWWKDSIDRRFVRKYR